MCFLRFFNALNLHASIVTTSQVYPNSALPKSHKVIINYLCIETRKTTLSCMVIASYAVRVAKVSTLITQRVDAPLLIDVQSAGVVDGQRGLCGHECVGLVQQPVASFKYRPKRCEVYEQRGHFRFVQHGTVNAVQCSDHKIRKISPSVRGPQEAKNLTSF